MKVKNSVLLMSVVSVLMVSGCTSVKVKPIDAGIGFNHACIQENPKVKVDDFVEVLEEGFQRHNISTEVYSGSKPSHCEFTVQYSAHKSFSIPPILDAAEIEIYRNGAIIASGRYRLGAQTAYNVGQYANTRRKISPVIDEILQNV